MHYAADRVEGLGSTVFETMSALATQHDAINLGQGFPEESGPSRIVEAAVEAMRQGQNQYTPGRGIALLRDAIAGHQHRYWGLEWDPETEIAVTTGATEAIATAVLGLVNPGDEVVMLEPFYDSYRSVVQMAGGVHRAVPMRAPDFRPDLDALHDVAGPQTKVIVLNTPHNPTGSVLSREELQAIADVAIEHDIVVVSDEVYEHLVFDGLKHIPIATLPGMRQRTLTISSAGKTFSFTGWKIGWASGPTSLVDAMVAAKQWVSYTSGAPFQPAIAAALLDAEEPIARIRQELVARRDQLCAGLTELGFGTHVPQGTYFATTDLRPLGVDDGVGFCERLPEDAGVAAIPCEAFFDDRPAGRPFVRWAFCKSEATIAEALSRLSDWLDDSVGSGR